MRAATLGETMGLVRSLAHGKLEHQHQMGLGFGGAESNVAIGLAQFGINVTWISRLGEDSLGDLIANGIRGQGVVLHVERDPDRQTGLMVREAVRPGLSRVFYYRTSSAAAAMNPSLLGGLNWPGLALFHTTGITFSLSPEAAETAKYALKLARDNEALTSLDANYRSRLTTPDAFRALLLDALPTVSVFFGSPDEVTMLTGSHHTPEQAAKSLYEQCGCDVVIKRGRSGATVFNGTDLIDYEGFTVEDVDTVGAGDAFVAGYLASFAQNKDYQRALEQGHTMGALSVMAPGDWEGQPHLRDLGLAESDIVR